MRNKIPIFSNIFDEKYLDRCVKFEFILNFFGITLDWFAKNDEGCF